MKWILTTLRAVMGTILVLGMWGCAQPQKTLVVTVGGLGMSQMMDVRTAVERECPEAKVVSAGMWDAYKTDLKALIKEYGKEHVVLIGHSYGCEAIDRAADELPRVDLAVFIDPAWSDFQLSKGIDQYLWFQRSNFDVIRAAKIVGASGAQQIPGGHNDLPHSPVLIKKVVAAVKSVAAQEGGALKRARSLANAAGATTN